MTTVQKSPFECIIQPNLIKLNMMLTCFMKSAFMKKVFFYIIFTCFIFWILLACVFLSHLNNFEDFVEGVLSIGCIIHVSVGVLVYYIYQEKINGTGKIIVENYWFDEYKFNTKMDKQHKLYYTLIQKIINFFAIGSITAAFVLYTYPTNLHERKFALAMRFPYYNLIQESPYYEITYILQITTLFIGTFIVIYTDIIYAAFTSFALIQIDFIKYKLKSINTNNFSEKLICQHLKECIQHHVLILQFLKNVDTIFKHVILCKILCNVLITTTSLKCILLAGKELKLKYFGVVFVSLFQPIIYCFLGDIVTSECESIGDAAYEVNWEDVPYKSVRTTLCMIIRRSQKPLFLKAGGLITLSLPNYVAFIKMIFSIYVLFEGQSIN